MTRSDDMGTPEHRTGRSAHARDGYEDAGTTGATAPGPVAVDAEVADAPGGSAGDDTVVADDRREAERRAAAGGTGRGSVPRQAGSDTGRSGGQEWSPRPRGVDPGEVRERWTTVQGGFVDDPARAVREADTLAEEVAAAVVSEIEARRSVLRSSWSGAGAADTADTESLRVALRDYRSFVERLLASA
ncbi:MULTISPECIES: hypothetical protein [unclassified Nocardiopsis]|uniref:hypothetical protein n=1 Tax=unclassified Nocardiopsis TaxID=2649073 RepID=UPI001F2E0DC6|nr:MULTISPECIES: hypothetical protein [unclassified Nocardiopsis]